MEIRSPAQYSEPAGRSCASVRSANNTEVMSGTSNSAACTAMNSLFLTEALYY